MNIALIADSNKKKLMENLCLAYSSILSKHELYATGNTGQSIQNNTGLKVNILLSGYLGGEQQLHTQLSLDSIDCLIYLRDSDHVDYFGSFKNEIFKICDSINVPYATNLASAEILILAISRGDLDWKRI